MTITNNDAKEEQKRILKLIDQRIDRADADWRSNGRNLIDQARLKELEGLKIDISLHRRALALQHTNEEVVMFKTITDAKTYYENSGRVNMEKPDNFSETALIEDLYRHADTEEQAEAILAKHIPN